MTSSTYQEQIYRDFEDFRPTAQFPIYPPYHKGLYLEEYFCETAQNHHDPQNYIFIPIHWTNCYKSAHDGAVPGLQNVLNSLSHEYKYFIVSTHDDAPRETLPPDTLCFGAGGNGGGIPIPLVCSSILSPPRLPKTLLASFIGSQTHPVRTEMAQLLSETQITS